MATAFFRIIATIRAYKPMKTLNDRQFKKNYDLHCKRLRLKGLQPKIINAYSRVVKTDKEGCKKYSFSRNMTVLDKFESVCSAGEYSLAQKAILFSQVNEYSPIKKDSAKYHDYR